MTLNPIEHYLDICSKDTQCTLHDDTETTTRFSTTTAGGSLATSQARVEASWQPDPITNNRAKRPPALINEPPNKFQKSLQRDRVHADPSAETAEDFNRDVQKLHPSAVPQRPDIALSWGDIETVQDSYRAAIRDGRLKYDRGPQLASEGPVWDPYILPTTLVRRAELNKDRVEEITQKVESTIRIVPKAVEWTAKTQEYSLTPEDVKEILQKAFVCQESSPKPQPEQNDKLPPILEVAAKALRRARELEDKRGTSRRGVAVLRMVAYASMEVSIVAKEATVEQVCTVDVNLFIALTSVGRILVEVTGWRERLAEAVSLFCPLLVLGDGKFASLEGSRITAVFHVGGRTWRVNSAHIISSRVSRKCRRICIVTKL
ncbi:hypothetical protein DL98DRAFT_522768 [Cadophora sp. DSE1049]|nr:hypothetical protein DL98DRAFT_522768 [Cadophora sp. DSE1049]